MEPALEVEGTKSELRTVPRTFPMAMFGKGSVGSGEVRPQKSLTWPDLVWRQFIRLLYRWCTAVVPLYLPYSQSPSPGLVRPRQKKKHQSVVTCKCKCNCASSALKCKCYLRTFLCTLDVYYQWYFVNANPFQVDSTNINTTWATLENSIGNTTQVLLSRAT